MQQHKHRTKVGTLCAALLSAGALVGACDAADSGSGPTGEGAASAGGSASGGGSVPTTTSTTGTDTIDDDGDGYSEAQGDCNDGSPDVYPGATEECTNGVDDNCNGALDVAEPDGDGDGYGPCQGDCDDANAEINPTATEVLGDGVDNNCDGTFDGDIDSDGFTIDDGDCDDGDAAVYPGAPEICWDNVDNDCDGFMDAAESDGDSDGWGPCEGDCDDGDPNVNPDADELPNNGVDDNCDNLVDDDVDQDGWTVDNGDCDDLDPDRNPSILEMCGNAIDDDCDGVTDADCVTACDIAALQRSSVGCEYLAIDTDNADANHDAMPYAVVVSNTDPVTDAHVEVQTRSGNSWQVIQTATVGPRALHQFTLPDRHIDHTGVRIEGAYRVLSDLPVIAYQFQPVDGVNSYSSDASLLLPVSSLDTIYHVVGMGGTVGGYMPQIAIVVAEDDTQITVTSPTATMAGGVVPALTAGVPYVFPQTYDKGDFVQISSTGGALAGTVVVADKPVAVFSAHEAIYIPAPCCADHLEEQMFGLQTWGTRYVAARMPVRNTGGSIDANIWHVYASENDTTVTFIASPQVTFAPALPGNKQITLQAGQTAQYSVAGTTANPGDFILEADKPILVMSYLTSSDQTNAAAQNAGDPAMAQMVPIEQLLDSYVVLVPPNWINDRLIISKPVGSTVILDGTPMAQASFLPINDGVLPVEWEVARVSAADGVHVLTGSEPFGVIVVGFDSWDSYAYPGGLDQQIINPIN